jgi:hypothetical protein
MGVETDVAAEEVESTRNGGVTLGVAVGAVFALVGAYVGSGRLSDNSFFTHLATGRIILDHGVPSTDPYTWHAAGESWTVQSWLASLIYALLDESMGLVGPRMFHMVLAATVAVGTWWLSRHCVSLVMRVAVAGLALATGGFFWVERPLMIGLACFCALWFLADRGPLWAIVPLMWVWVNSHGSFPLGVALVVCLLVGRLMDRGDASRPWRVVGLTVLGTLLGGVLSPVAGTILVFPLTLLERTDQLQAVSEWRSPNFADWGPRLFLAMLLLGLMAARRVDRWELIVPAVVFSGAALLGARNVPLAALALTPLLAAGAPVLGTLRASDRSRFGRVLLGVSVAGFALLTISMPMDDHLDLSTYPLTEILALEDEGILPDEGTTVAYRDTVGNYLEYRYGPQQNVFFDDRFDFYSSSTLQDMIDLHNGRRVLEILDEYDIDVVIWEDETATADQLSATEGWQKRPELDPFEGTDPDGDGSTGWVIFERTP